MQATRARRQTIPPIQRFAIPLFWAAVLIAFVFASMPQPVALPGNPDDKIQHIVAFVVLTILATLAYPRIPQLVIFAGLCLLGGLIELVQLIPPLNRDGNWMDWAADTLAVAVTLGAIQILRRLGRSATS